MKQDLPEEPGGETPQPSPHHAQGGFGRPSAAAAGGERVPEAGAGGGVCGFAPGQHAADCGGYVRGPCAGGSLLWALQPTPCDLQQ